MNHRRRTNCCSRRAKTHAAEQRRSAATPKQKDHNMNPSSALCLGVAWQITAGFTGADEWLKSCFGKSKVSDLEEKVAKLEKRLDELEKK